MLGFCEVASDAALRLVQIDFHFFRYAECIAEVSQSMQTSEASDPIAKRQIVPITVGTLSKAGPKIKTSCE